MSQPVPYPCPRCGAVFSLTPEYLAQYGGQTTQCTACGQPFALPMPGAVVAQVPVAQPRPAAAPIPVLPYSGPAPASSGAWAEGRTLVAAKDADVSHCCLKCGGPPGKRIRKTFYWHESWVYVTILAGLLVYVILALVLRKSGAVHYTLCARHRQKRLNGILIGLGMIAAGIVLFVVAGNVDEPAPFIALGIGGLFFGLIWALLAARSLTPTKIDERYLWLKGAGVEFLQTLPSTQAFQQPAAYPYPTGQM